MVRLHRTVTLLTDNYITMTPAHRSAARKVFLNFVITAVDETFLIINQKYNELLRKVIVQGGVVDARDRLETLLNALPKKNDILRESFFAQIPAPRIENVWDGMYDIETTQKRRVVQSGAPGMGGESYYQTKRGFGGSRGRGRGVFGGRGVQQRVENKAEKCFKCGEGKVFVTQWGVVRLSIDKANGEKGELELHEVLFIPDLNTFSLQ